ncbi:MAG: IS4 family transposase [Actinomycetota bacterium]
MLGPLREKLESAIEQIEGGQRSRVFTPKITATAMIMSALQEDKTLQNSVMLVKQISQQEGIDVSLNTASYTTARQRLTPESMHKVYQDVVAKGLSGGPRWHKREVYLMDGTYIQLRDTLELRKKYPFQQGHKCPSGLLVGAIHAGSGQLADFELSDRYRTELELGHRIMQRLPTGNVVVVDELYSSFCFLYLAKHYGIDMVAPCKRKRSFKVIASLGKGDDLVEITFDRTRRKASGTLWWEKVDVVYPKTLRLRRIQYNHPKNGKPCTLLTTLLDPDIPAQDIVLLYTKRWDVELSIRELKTIMDIDIVRSKSEDMVFKELLAAFIGYNLIRQLMKEADPPSFFPSDEALFQKFVALTRSRPVDTLGRRPSTGRPRRSLAASST